MRITAFFPLFVALLSGCWDRQPSLATNDQDASLVAMGQSLFNPDYALDPFGAYNYLML